MFKIKTTQLLNFLISKLEKWRSKLQKKEEERVDMPFHALTPVTLQKKNENQEDEAEDKT
jgi:hypothetical protein